MFKLVICSFITYHDLEQKFEISNIESIVCIDIPNNYHENDVV